MSASNPRINADGSARGTLPGTPSGRHARSGLRHVERGATRESHGEPGFSKRREGDEWAPDGIGAVQMLGPVGLELCDATALVETSTAWKIALTGAPPAGWHNAGFDDSAYVDAVNVTFSGWYDPSSSRWIWDGQGNQPSGEERSFRREFTLSSSPAHASLLVSADNGCEVRINGTLVVTHGSPRGEIEGDVQGWATGVTFVIDPAVFVVGVNCISIIGWNATMTLPGPAGVYAVLTVGVGGSEGTAARCDHGHVHNNLSARDAASGHPATAVTDSGGSTVQAAIDSLRARGWKQSVRVATTAAGTLASSFENGDTVDGVVLATGNRILLKDQAAGAENGIYTVNASGAPTRATDMDASAEVLGAVALVEEGTANADKVFRCTNNATIALGTTALVFTEISGGAAVDYAEDADISTQAFGDAPAAGASATEVAGANHKHGMPSLGTGSTNAATGNHTHAAAESARAVASGALTVTGTAQDVAGATLSLAVGTYIVTGVFDVTDNSADRTFEGICDVGGTDEADFALLTPAGITGDRMNVIQVWRVVLASTTTVKLQARHSGGTTGDFMVNAANTAIVAYMAGGASAAVGVKVHASGTTSVLNGTMTPVAFAAEDDDTDGFHDNATNNTRLTVPAGKAGVYAIVGNVEWDTNITGERILLIRSGGAAELSWTRGTGLTAGGTGQTTAALARLAVGDYVELVGYQTSGTTRTVGATVRTRFGMYLLGMGSGGGSVATDAIWDAAGDLAVGSGTDTAARLAIGAAGGALSVVNGAVAWNSGTTMPPTPAIGDRRWRTDLGMEFYWDGTRWLCTCPHTMQLFNSTSLQPFSVNSTVFSGLAVWPGMSNIYIATLQTTFLVNAGGSALSASHKWVASVRTQGPAGAVALGTVTIASGASDAWRADVLAVALNLGTNLEVDMGWVKTGTPGALLVYSQLLYRNQAV